MQLIKTSTVIDETDLGAIKLELEYRFILPSDRLAVDLANKLNAFAVKVLQQFQDEQDRLTRGESEMMVEGIHDRNPLQGEGESHD